MNSLLSEEDLILIIAGMAFVTYISRWLPLAFLTRLKPSPLFLRWLSFVPVSVFSTLVTSSLLTSQSKFLTQQNVFYLMASLPTFLIAAWTRNLMLSVVAGVLTLALLRLVS